MILDKINVIGEGIYRALSGDAVYIDIQKLNDCKIIQDCKADNVESALRYAYSNPPHINDTEISAMETKRNDIYMKTKKVYLENVLMSGCAFCRERSIFLHILLAQLGVNSTIYTGTDPDLGRHTFVTYKQDGILKVLDPMNSTNTENMDDYIRFNEDFRKQNLVASKI